MAEFKRTKEIDKLISFLNNNKVNIVAGLRRCGKTYLLTSLFKNELIERGLFSPQEIGILSLADDDKYIKSVKRLSTVINELINKELKVLIVDEVQLINGYTSFFSEFVKDNTNITLYISGSNSDILSTDIIRHFKELANPLYLRPLTYMEIIEEKIDYSFDDYILFGGLPLIVNCDKNQRIKELRKIYEEIYELDVKDRLEGKLNYLSKKHIDEILKLLASSVSPFSPSQVASRLSKGIDRTKFDMMLLIKDIEDVLDFLDKSFLIYAMEVDDFNNVIPLSNIGLNKKYYFGDNGIRYINCESQYNAMSNCLENAVYLELLAKDILPKGKIILDKKRKIIGEIDFNFELNNETYHLQITHTITPKNYDREIGNLLSLNDCSNKIVIYLNDLVGKKDKNIKYLKGDEYFIS